MTEPLTGLDEAVDVACRAFFADAPLGWDELSDGTREWLRHRERRHLERVYPIIAAAVRADERAKVLAEVEAALKQVIPGAPRSSMWRAVTGAVRALGTKP